MQERDAPALGAVCWCLAHWQRGSPVHGGRGPSRTAPSSRCKGTPHLWFADEHGVLHWGGDTRALAGQVTLPGATASK